MEQVLNGADLCSHVLFAKYPYEFLVGLNSDFYFSHGTFLNYVLVYSVLSLADTFASSNFLKIDFIDKVELMKPAGYVDYSSLLKRFQFFSDYRRSEF